MNYKDLSLEELEQQRANWLAKYKGPITELLDLLLDAMGKDIVGDHNVYRTLETGKILIIRSAIIGRYAKVSGTLYRVFINPALKIDKEYQHFTINAWDYQPVYLLVGSDELGTLNYSTGEKPTYYITPGDWINEVKKLESKAEAILRKAANKGDRLDREKLYNLMSLDIAREIDLK